MKNFAALVIFLAVILMAVKVDAAPIPLRGVVEGFYGTPFAPDNRADLMKFCRQHNLNAYIYAPKDDLYHREKWREPYPFEKLEELKKLVQLADSNGVRFIFAVSPGLDLNYDGTKGDEDFELLKKKLETLYRIGVRNFAIFLDDLKDENGVHHEDGKKQAAFLNRLQLELRKLKHTAPLITVPTEYYRLDMARDGKVNQYTADFSKTLDKNIVVLYTGEGVVCDGISAEEFSAACKIYGRDLGIWWNYPVNDYALTADGERNAKLALGAIEKLPARNVQAVFFNPMSQYELSKIALATGADYANSPETYDAEKSWNAALNEQFGKLAQAMKIFAGHSRHMENSWAKVGPRDAPDFQMTAEILLKNFRAGNKVDFSMLSKMLDEMESAADTLLKNLPPEILAECKPQLEQFKRIAHADKIALTSLQNLRLDPTLKVLRDEISRHERSAAISEQAAVKFLDEAIALLN